jgi:hypothetical protein
MATGYFFIITPLQYLCALEAKNYFQNEITLSKLIILNRLQETQKTTLSQLNNIISRSDWDSIEYIKMPNMCKKYKYINIIIEYAYFKLKLKKIINKIRMKDLIIIGNMNDLWFQWLLGVTISSKKIILDDGLGTINIIKNFTNKIKKVKTSRGVFLLKKLLNPKSIELKKISLFSLYNKVDFYPATFIHNELKYIKSIYLKSHYERIPKAIFIGQPLSEAGIVSLESYIYMINTLKEYCTRQGVELVYLCHRAENISLLPQHWNIQELSIPIEIHLISQDSLPKMILSFYSSALLNLKMLLPQISQIVAVRIPDSLINRHMEEIRNVYNYFEKERGSTFSIVDLEAIKEI